MANRRFQQFQGTLEHGIIKLFGVVTLGASGAVSSQSCKGFSIAKTSAKTGRYTVTLEDNYLGLLAAQVTLEGSADTVYTSAKGLGVLLRNVAVSTTAKTFDIQFVDRQTAPADANPEDSAKFYVEITLKNSSAY